jgi:hypothetical protein
MRGLLQVLMIVCTSGWPLSAASVNGEGAPPAEPGFGEEKEGLIGDLFLGAGYDSNANSGTEAERYFFYDLFSEQRDSESGYATAGASVLANKRIGGNWSWRSGLGGSATSYPSAHFADTQDGSAQTQLRHTTRKRRVAIGGVYSVRAIDGHRSDTATAAGLKVEQVIGARLLTFSAETARIRFPDLPLRDVDTVFGRIELGRAPVPNLRWQPRFVVYGGREEGKEPDSPFGRDVWGVGIGGEERFSGTLSVDGEIGYTQSKYDEVFLAPERREDEGFSARLYWHVRTHEKSRWEHSFGARFRRNDSTDPLYEFDRVVVGYEIATSWGEAE